ncbi:MAG TPA: T9SS type A sorting domain-containing protein, partial [Chitinophagales bacterium]|nr:T9SS type A sorting domain-containing protein [Chitinophagales bacterium]
TGCIATQDGGFLITGYTGSSDSDIPYHYGVSAFYDALIFKTDSAGNIQWLKVIGGSSPDHAANPLEIDSGRYFILLASSSNDYDFEGIGVDDSFKMLFCELNASGEIVYQNYYTPDKELKTYLSKSMLYDGKVMLVNAIAEGSEYIESYGLEDGVIAVLDDSLHFSTIKNFGGSKNDALLRVVADDDGNYYFLGYSFSPDGDLPGNYNDGAYNDYCLMATDHNFNLLWSRNFGGKFNNNKSDVSTLQGNLIVDENYITCFISCVVPDSFPDMDIECGFPSLSSGYRDAWIVRFNLNTVSVQEPPLTPDFFTVFPNPTQNQMTITMNQDISSCYNNYVVLMDMKGRKIAEAEFFYTYSMDVSNLAPGLYTVLVYCNEFLQYKKIVIQH